MLENMQFAGRESVELKRAAAPVSGWHCRDEVIMGTSIRAELWSEDAALGRSAIAAVMAEMHRIDRTMSPYKPDSELSRINRDAARMPVTVSRELFDLIACSLAFSEVSGGAFDITYASAGFLYDYRQKIRPTAEALAAACAAIGYRKLVLDADALTVRFTQPGMRIDLGGFAKGHAVDNCAAILRRLGIAHAAVAAGGDSHVIGDRRGRPWTVGVRDPRREGEVVALLPLEDAAVSTSGDYERYFEVDGERCHHVIDPTTGRSPAGVRSVTVIAPDGLTAEALSKCVFVMGVQAGLRLVESHAAVDAVVVDAAGALHYSSGLTGAGALTRQ